MNHRVASEISAVEFEEARKKFEEEQRRNEKSRLDYEKEVQKHAAAVHENWEGCFKELLMKEKTRVEDEKTRYVNELVRTKKESGRFVPSNHSVRWKYEYIDGHGNSRKTEIREDKFGYRHEASGMILFHLPPSAKKKPGFWFRVKHCGAPPDDDYNFLFLQNIANAARAKIEATVRSVCGSTNEDENGSCCNEGMYFPVARVEFKKLKIECSYYDMYFGFGPENVWRIWQEIVLQIEYVTKKKHAKMRTKKNGSFPYSFHAIPAWETEENPDKKDM